MVFSGAQSRNVRNCTRHQFEDQSMNLGDIQSSTLSNPTFISYLRINALPLPQREPQEERKNETKNLQKRFDFIYYIYDLLGEHDRP